MTVIVDSLVPSGYLKSAHDAGIHQSAWKFVLIKTIDAIYFVCGPVVEYEYHANLVDRFCDHHEIGSTWERKPDVVGILDPDIQVLGGGHIRLDSVAMTAKIYGRSTAYGPFNPGDLACIPKNSTFLEDYDLHVVGQ